MTFYSNNKHKKSKKGFYFVLILLLSTELCAQNVNPLDKSYTPPNNSVFGVTKNEGCVYYQNEELPRSTIKLAATELIRGEFRMSYEYKLNKVFALDFGIGKPFIRDIVERVSIEIRDEFSENKDGSAPLSSFYDNSALQSGFLYSFSFRYYFNNGFDNPLSLNLTYKMVTRNNVISGSSHNPTDYNVKNQYFTFSLGKSWVQGRKKIKFIQTFNLGVGIKYVCWDNYIDNGSTFWESKYIQNGQKESFLFPCLTLHYQIGFGW